MSPLEKPVVLTFVGHYLPGYKAGGTPRTVINIVDHLCEDFEFKIVTRDRDLGEDKPYADIEINQWQQVGNAMVYYLSPQSSTVRDIFNLILSTRHNVLYLNSFFDLLTIKVLLNRKFRRITLKPVIVAPRGEFGWASLKHNYTKKFIFIQSARLFGLYQNVTWQASNEFEAQDIINVMRVDPYAIHNTRDLPSKITSDDSLDATELRPRNCEGLKVVFLSRISRGKNLDYALRVLGKVKARVFFDIYGPAENATYWKECAEIISRLPDNVTVKYRGTLKPSEVQQTFSCYDLFLFPTGGENYGHVIAESLTSGTPVLISTETPWRDLQTHGLGWDIDLAHMDSFVEIVERFALLSHRERAEKRIFIKSKILDYLLDPALLESNRQLFRKTCCELNIL